MSTELISDDDLERYCLGTISEPELARIEEHMLFCHSCLTRAEETLEYLDTMRRALANEIASRPGD